MSSSLPRSREAKGADGAFLATEGPAFTPASGWDASIFLSALTVSALGIIQCMRPPKSNIINEAFLEA